MKANFHFEQFSPRRKKDVVLFLKKLGPRTRSNLSVSGIDTKGIYHSFRLEWKTSLPICLYKNKEVIGICKLKRFEKKSMYLSCLVIVDRLQGLRFGSRLLNYSFAIAKFAGMERMYLEVKKDNKIAKKCFEKHGFLFKKEDQETYMMVKYL